jgi:hypothetical protein
METAGFRISCFSQHIQNSIMKKKLIMIICGLAASWSMLAQEKEPPAPPVPPVLAQHSIPPPPPPEPPLLVKHRVAPPPPPAPPASPTDALNHLPDSPPSPPEIAEIDFVLAKAANRAPVNAPCFETRAVSTTIKPVRHNINLDQLAPAVLCLQLKCLQ